MKPLFFFALPVTLLAADLPIREIVLYKHGVGYFQRAGALRAGETARLDFKAPEMNDVLKSLTIEEKGGGKVSGLRYDSSEPLGQKLAEFPFRVDGQQSLAGFLDQVKGARLEMKYGAETVSGVVVGARMTPATEKHPEREQVLLLLDSGELRTFDLSAAGAIQFPDAKLRDQLKEYLGAVSQSRSKDKRSLYIDSTEAKGREIVASYMVPAAVWKSTYRLIFGEKSDPILEGWAIVDNTTGEDWNNVHLSVVSGRPISFISLLYEPRYVQRPTADLDEGQPLAPTVYQGAVGGLAAKETVGDKVKKDLGRFRQQQFASGQQLRATDEEKNEIASSVAATATGRNLGDLFEYHFDSPVTVKKSESAMLPFFQEKIHARKLDIYSDSNGQNAMNAVELVNGAGKTLDGGPITVYDANAYAGEALMETTKAGDKRLISYGVDLGTRVTTAFGSERQLIREVHFRRGTLTTRTALQETKTYTIRNADAKEKTLIIEYPVRAGYKLLELKPASTTLSAYRFEVKLNPRSTETFPVKEERLVETSTVISSQTSDDLAVYLQNKGLSEAARKQLEQILAAKRSVAGNDGELHRTEAGIQELGQDQERTRQNIYTLNQVAGQQEQVQKYSRQLAGIEVQLAAQRDRLRDLQHKKAALEQALNSLIETMEF